MEAAITNPSGAFYGVTDFRTGLDGAGAPLQYGQRAFPFRADATITKGQALMWVAPTATVPLSVAPMTAAIAASDSWLFAGAALEAGVAGDEILVLRDGFGVVVTEAADTPAFGGAVRLPDTTTGAFAISDPAAGETQVGTCFGPEIGTTNTAFVYIGWVAGETTA